MATTSFYGRGYSFPLQLDSTTGRIKMVSDSDLIKCSIRAILLTDVSDRPFTTRNGIPFGTRIRRALFADVDTASEIIKFECKRALDLWEPRIQVTSVTTAPQVVDQKDVIVTRILFTERRTNREDNFVYPFRLESPER